MTFVFSLFQEEYDIRYSIIFTRITVWIPLYSIRYLEFIRHSIDHEIFYEDIFIGYFFSYFLNFSPNNRSLISSYFCWIGSRYARKIKF